MSEWHKFKVGDPVSRGFNPKCMPFDSVSHISHVNAAISIVEIGEIRPSLVFDESKLRDQRILVNWFSPNDWYWGFRYGNVRFGFLFGELIEGRRYYWVESIAYSPPACRILITDVDRDSELCRYDPTTKDGPWWFDSRNDKHYYNDTYCLEFMLEASVPLKRLKKFGFVDHHPDYCSVHRSSPKRCRELGTDRRKGAALFLTRAVVTGTDLSQVSHHFLRNNGKPSDELEDAFSAFFLQIPHKLTFSGSLNKSSKDSVAMMRAVMSAFTFGNIEEARLLAASFQNEAEFKRVAAKVFAGIVGLEEWEALCNS